MSSGSARATTRISRPTTGRSRLKTTVTTTSYTDSSTICAISQSRGLQPSVGLALIDMLTYEAVLCQFTDTQTFARTCHKLKVFSPSTILHTYTATDSKLISIVQEAFEHEEEPMNLIEVDRKYWSETAGHGYIRQLALPSDAQALELSLIGHYFAICCFAAVIRYIDLHMQTTFHPQSLRIRFESSEGTMMIDLSTIANLELVQNLQNAKSKDCLFGVLNLTQTCMGARFLKSNILQPSTDAEKIRGRLDAVEEISTTEELFFGIKEALNIHVDTDRTLAMLLLNQPRLDFQYMEQSVNNVLMLKTFVVAIKPIWQTLSNVFSADLRRIQMLCDPENFREIEELLINALEPETEYATSPLDLRNQRTFAIKAGTNGFLDVARQSHQEHIGDVRQHIEDLKAEYELPIELKYDNQRQFFIRIRASDVDTNKPFPAILINIFKQKSSIECQTLQLVKFNQKIKDAHNEVIAISDATIQELIAQVRPHLQPLFRISEAIALLDLLTTFANHITKTKRSGWVRPDLFPETLALKSAVHPVLVNIQKTSYIPNDVYATAQYKRFQIITGANMSGKSTYIRSVALLTILAQIGCYVPAEYASIPIPLFDTLFARVATDDCIEANVSSFASEMREMASILSNITSRSLVVIDELGRGTSTADGFAIAIAVSEALIQRGAYVWFVTHFRDLPRVLAERVGVVNLHMSADIDDDYSRMRMYYKIKEGCEKQNHYGLAIAQLMSLPERVMNVAVQVLHEINEQNARRQQCSRSSVLTTARRRKLVVHMRESLSRVINSCGRDVDRAELIDRLRKLQEEFLIRMAAAEAVVPDNAATTGSESVQTTSSSQP